MKKMKKNENDIYKEAQEQKLNKLLKYPIDTPQYKEFIEFFKVK